MIKLIMSDMDGTLLDENSELPQGFDEMIAQLAAKNILFAPASGRQYYCLLRQFERYADSFVFIAENGSYVLYKGRELFSGAMDTVAVQAMLKIAATIPETQAVLCGKKSAYVLPGSSEDFINEIELYYARCQVVESFATVADDILKIAICDFGPGGSEYNSYPCFADYTDQLKIVVSGQHWMDIMQQGVNKGVAVAHIQQMLSITPEECMAFGDYMNDFEMMSAVYHSYAMDNAHPQIKEIARFSAKSNRENGVITAIQEMLAKEDRKQRGFHHEI